MTATSLHDTYQATPYPSRPVPLSHPDHLYVVGRLHGLSPADVATARVLELGCASGGNLLPMAASLPEGRFIGVDLSERQVAMAQAAARAAGLENAEFRAGDALAVLSGGGEEREERFDYVILHGLYSWVPLEVQAELLPLCARLLAPGGMAYVSYNTFPGWHGRGTVRDLMLRAAAGLDDPGAQVRAARGALDDLASAYAQDNDAYAKLLAEEQARVAEMEDSFLLHDLLEVENHPVYAAEFMARAAAAGLQFVSEANVAASREENFSPEAQNQLRALTDTTEREQRIDFILNRSFRQTLLTTTDAPVQRRIDPNWLSGMYMASPLRPMGPDPNGAPGEAFFATPDGGRIGMTAPNAIAALNHLALAWPEFIHFPDLAATVGDGSIVAQLAIDLYPRNWLDLLPRPPAFTKTPGDWPMATALARWQVQQGEMVTDQRHRNVTITDGFTRQLLPLLDGETGRDALIRAVDGFDREPGAQIANDDSEAHLDAALFQLAERCLLVQ